MGLNIRCRRVVVFWNARPVEVKLPKDALNEAMNNCHQTLQRQRSKFWTLHTRNVVCHEHFRDQGVLAQPVLFILA